MEDVPTPRLESALIIPVPEVDSLIGRWRQRHDPAARLGIPAHITLIYPFLPPERMHAGILQGIRALAGRHRAFAFSLTHVESFPTAIYLSPKPAEPFVRLIETLAARFPEAPPYGGEFTSIVPHVTIAQHADASTISRLLAELHGALRPQLPLAAYAREVRLIEGQGDAIWSVRHSFPLRLSESSIIG